MEHVTLLGTGLIGGSIGLGLLEQSPEMTVTGYDRDPGSAARALDRGAVSTVSADPVAAVRGADLVVLAVPLGQFLPLLDVLATDLPEGATVTDVGSAKGAVVTAGEAALGSR